VLAGIRLDPADFRPCSCPGGLPNLKAMMDAAVGVIVMAHLARYAAGLCVAGYGALQLLGRRAGSTQQERRQALAGDGTVLHPHAVTDHAITIGAPPEAVWPWLTQMGWHRGGWYTPRWVDRLLFPANLPSADVLDPGLVRELAVGDTIADGPPGSRGGPPPPGRPRPAPPGLPSRRPARRLPSCSTPPPTSRRRGRRSSAQLSTGRGVSI
jgi:hypothetical protein